MAGAAERKISRERKIKQPRALESVRGCYLLDRRTTEQQAHSDKAIQQRR